MVEYLLKKESLMEIGAVANTVSTTFTNLCEGAVYYGGRAWTFSTQQASLFYTWASSTASHLWTMAQPYTAYALDQAREKAMFAGAFVYANPLPCAVALALIVTLAYALYKIN